MSVLSTLDEPSAFFWKSGADGKLRFLHEAVLQLRGEGGDRQVPGDPEIAVVANGGGPVAGAMLLTRIASSARLA